MGRHKYKIGQVLLYETNVYVLILEQIPYDPEFDFSPAYKTKLIRSGMPLILAQHELKDVTSSELLSNKSVIDLLCECGAKHTIDWNLHSAWCPVSNALEDKNA